MIFEKANNSLATEEMKNMGTFKFEDSKDSPTFSSSCNIIPGRPMGIRTDPPALTESKTHEHKKSIFSISSVYSLESSKYLAVTSKLKSLYLELEESLQGGVHLLLSPSTLSTSEGA
nr:hypothetical protein Iba_chr06fCG6350 [Ipomoea batatas]